MKKRKWIVVILLFLFLSLAENCTGPVWSGCNPPYLLCFTVLSAMFFGEKISFGFALAAGLFSEAYASGFFGFRTVLFLILAYVIAALSATVLARNILSAGATGLAACFIMETGVWGAMCLKTPVPFTSALRYVILPRCGMYVPVFFILYWFFSRFCRERDVIGRRW